MATFISVEPDSYILFNEDDVIDINEEFLSGTGNKFEDALMRAYLNKAMEYENSLKKIKQSFPSLPINFSVKASAKPEIILLDKELDATLMKIYVLYGWEGILKIQSGIFNDRTKDWSEELDSFVRTFYMFTRNRLLLLIRRALISIEKKAAQDIVTQLSLTATVLANAYSKLTLQENTSQKESATGGGSLYAKEGSSKGDPEQAPIFSYSMKDGNLSKKIYTIFNKYLIEKNLLQSFIQQRKDLMEQIKYEEYERARNNIPIYPLTSGQLSVEEKKKKLNEAETLLKETSNLFNELTLQIGEISGVLFLSIPQFSVNGFDQLSMENIIGRTIQSFYKSIDTLGRKINPAISQIEKDFEDTDFNSSQFLNCYPYNFSFESECIKKALDKVSDNEAYLVLISEQTLHRLIQNYPENLGSLEHVVTVRYITELIIQLESKRQTEKDIGGFFKILAVISAALELIAAFAKINSETAVISIPAGFISRKLLGIPSLIFMSYSIVHQLSLFDQEINQRLIQADTSNIESLVRLGEISAMRKEYTQNIIEQIGKEILLMIAAHNFHIFKKIVHLRGYYMDIETLIDN